MQQHRKSSHPGIVARHQRSCATRSGGKRCNCRKTWQASVWSAREGKRKKKHFRELDAAKAWRDEARVEIRKPGTTLSTKKSPTFDQVANEWLEGIKAETIVSRTGHPFKPSTIRGYERSLRQRILPKIGRMRIAEITRRDVQKLVDGWTADNVSASAIGNRLDPLRSIFKRSVSRELVAVNPTKDLELRSPKSSKAVRIAAPTEARDLLQALPDGERAIWAAAFFAGLRRGELLALRWSDVDLEKSQIRVSRSWDQYEGDIDPKSKTSTRTVPLLGELRRHLVAHKLATGRDGSDLVFGRTADEPPVPSTVRSRAHKAWEDLEPIALHHARHTFASLLIDSGANPKAVQEFMGHSTITITFDLYGHLMPGAREETRKKVDAYLEEALS